MNTVKSFLQEVREELKKIVWPEKKEFIFSFIVTLLIVIFFSIFFAIVDGTIASILNKIIIYSV